MVKVHDTKYSPNPFCISTLSFLSVFRAQVIKTNVIYSRKAPNMILCLFYNNGLIQGLRIRFLARYMKINYYCLTSSLCTRGSLAKITNIQQRDSQNHVSEPSLEILKKKTLKYLGN